MLHQLKQNFIFTMYHCYVCLLNLCESSGVECDLEKTGARFYSRKMI